MFSQVNPTVRYRQEQRYNPHLFVEVKVLEGMDGAVIDALTADISESGIALFTYLPLPIGTKVAISLKDDRSINGEVTDLEQSDYYDLMRVGIRFTEKGVHWSL